MVKSADQLKGNSPFAQDLRIIGSGLLTTNTINSDRVHTLKNNQYFRLWPIAQLAEKLGKKRKILNRFSKRSIPIENLFDKEFLIVKNQK